MSVKKTLAERDKTHGKFASNAYIGQSLKRVMHTQANWQALSPEEAEALDMIASKIARIISTAPRPNVDSWHDIGGYAALGEEIARFFADGGESFTSD